VAIPTKAVGDFYLVAVLFVPTEAERIEGKKKIIAVTPTFVLADDPQAASSKAILMVDRSFDPDRLEVLVTKPF
jgi:hypothetical protein